MSYRYSAGVWAVVASAAFGSARRTATMQREPIERDVKRALEHHRTRRERQRSSTPLGTAGGVVPEMADAARRLFLVGGVLTRPGSRRRR
jgi:hypothetical protein